MVYEYELIQERKISGKGILKVPFAQSKNRAYVLYASVFRLPKNPYLNLNYNPGRSRYGTLCFLRNGYVVNTAPIEFKNQAFDGVNDISGQTLLAVKCAYEGVLQSILRLSQNLAFTPGSIGLQPINYTNLISAYTNLNLSWNECRLQCYADTAIELKLYRLKYEVCNDDFETDVVPPTPPPIADIPPGTPISGIDSSYNGTGDNGNTSPYPGDGVPTPPPQPCVTVIRGAGLNTNGCVPLNNLGDYSYSGYAELRPITYQGCPGLRLFLDGVDQGEGQTYHSSAAVLSRTGDCTPP